MGPNLRMAEGQLMLHLFAAAVGPGPAPELPPLPRGMPELVLLQAAHVPLRIGG